MVYTLIHVSACSNGRMPSPGLGSQALRIVSIRARLSAYGRVCVTGRVPRTTGYYMEVLPRYDGSNTVPVTTTWGRATCGR
jgi:hypothetical protein